MRCTVVALDTDSSVLNDDVGQRCCRVFDPDRRTGLSGVDDAGRINGSRSTVDSDGCHVVSIGSGAVDVSTVHHVQRSAGADVQGCIHAGVPCDISEVSTVKRERTAVLDVKGETVRRRNGADGCRVAGRTFIVGRQEARVLDGDHRRRSRRALNTEGTALQLETTGVKHQVGSHGDRRVIKGERVHTVPVSGQVGVRWVVDELVTVERWVVEHNWCRLQEQVQVRSPGVTAGWVPGTRQGSVRVVVGVGLVLTCGTEGSDHVVFVSRSVAVPNDNPNAGVSVSIRGVLADGEQFVHAAVEQ